METTLQLARKARAYFPLTDRVSRCRQAARYARAIALLGDRWILAQPVRQSPSGLDQKGE
jgi:hypothetical protein